LPGLQTAPGWQGEPVSPDNLIPLAIAILLFFAVIVWPIVGVTLAAT
jgi:hypothetical protein